MSKSGEPKSQRKVFVGGISVKTTEETFRDHFSQYGELVDSVVMSDPQTKKSRGFGFLEYATVEQVDACQAARPHVLDGKEVETKRAIPRDRFANADAGQSVKKIFAGGLRDLDEGDLQIYFGQFGNCVSVNVMTDKTTGKKRGFGFIEFDDYDTVDRIILHGEHIVNGTRIDVKKAVEKKDMNSPAGGGRGGRGGKVGGYGGDSGGYGSGFGGGGAWSGGYGNQPNGGYGGNQGYGATGNYVQGGGGFGGGYGQDQSFGGSVGGGYGQQGGFGGGYGGAPAGGFGGSNRGFGGGPMRNGPGQGRGGRGSPYTGGGRGRGGR